jgi:hypothetical protein
MKVACDFPKNERAGPAEETSNVRSKYKYWLGDVDNLEK